MTIKGTIKIDGLDQFRAECKAAARTLTRAAHVGQYKAASEIMRESLRQCPLDQGWLRNSHYVTPAAKTVELGYGADYAVHVHERTRPTNWSEPGTGPKFLEKPMKQAARSGEIDRWIARETRGAIRSGVVVNPPKAAPTRPKGRRQ